MTEKRCSSCRETKPATSEFFRAGRKKGSVTLRGTCRECELRQRQEARERRRESGPACSVDGCGKPALEGEYCHQHAKHRRAGRPLVVVHVEPPSVRYADAAIAYHEGRATEDEVFGAARSWARWAREHRIASTLKQGEAERGDPRPLILAACAPFAEADTDAEFLHARALLHHYALRLGRMPGDRDGCHPAHEVHPVNEVAAC